jgi:hypothetical protein
VEPSKLQCLFKSWGHSREEDADGLTIYRPSGFAFPLSRGRDWIEFRPDGGVLHLGSGPDDRSRAVAGSWASVGHDILEVRRPAETAPRRMTVVYCDAHVLKVRWD